jgi:integrase
MLSDDLLTRLTAHDKPLKKSDGGGLLIRVEPSGRKIWQLAYRFDGKQKTLSGGIYPDTSLSQARAWRDRNKRLIAGGTDPSSLLEERKFQRRANALTFEALAIEWLKARKSSWSPRYYRITKRRLEADIILPRHVLEVLRLVEQRGSVGMAHRLRGTCSEIFRYGIPDGRVDSDPCRDLISAMVKLPATRHMAKVEAKDLPTFFRKLNADQGSRMSHLALRWTMLTMVRTQETRFATWSEFEGLGTDEPVWRIPAGRMKMRTEHVVPLPPQAITLLREIRDENPYGLAGNERFGKYLFPVAGSRSDTISENRMLDILYRMGLRGKVTVHGFRSLASTVLNESGLFLPDWIELQLAHVPRGVRGIYNSARYLDHRRKMLNWWGDYLDAAEAQCREPAAEHELADPATTAPLQWFQSKW